MKSENCTDCTKELSSGNTILNSRCRRYCFTLNNYSEEEFLGLISIFETWESKYIIGKKVGESGTPHLQGYVEHKNPKSFSCMKKLNDKIHWEKAKGNLAQNIKYCSKDNDFKSNIRCKENRLMIKLRKYDSVTWKPWQQKIIDIIEGPKDDRKVFWYWEKKGNSGKSFLTKYLYLKYKVIIGEGKLGDVFNQVKTYVDEKNEEPNVILLDIPRSSLNYINFSAIEKMKNGLIYSGKYEGGVVEFDSPHVIIFANEIPDWDELSEDRWDVRNIDDYNMDFNMV